MVDTAEELLREAEDQIEAWLCELDETWLTTLGRAEHRASELIAAARVEAARIVAGATVEADQLRQEGAAELERLRAIAGEHADAIRALAAADAAAARAVDDEQLEALREAVRRLRTELSRVVDAAFDAFPAVEATADALDRAMTDGDDVLDEERADDPAPDLVGAGTAPARRGLLRRLFRRHS